MCVSRAGQGPRIAESWRNKSARSAGSTCHFFTTGGRRGRGNTGVCAQSAALLRYAAGELDP